MEAPEPLAEVVPADRAQGRGISCPCPTSSEARSRWFSFLLFSVQGEIPRLHGGAGPSLLASAVGHRVAFICPPGMGVGEKTMGVRPYGNEDKLGYWRRRKKIGLGREVWVKGSEVGDQV